MVGIPQARRRAIALVVCIGVLAAPLIARGASGDLDSTFGKGGVTLTAVGFTGSGAARVAVDPEGRIVTAGVSFDGLGEDTDADFSVVRHTAKGKLDKSFGTSGAQVFNFGESYVWELPNDLALTADGKILVGGSTEVGSFESGAGIARLNADGTFDTSLAGDGTLSTNPEGLDEATAVLPVDDGDFYAVGPSGGHRVVVARFNADGSLDAGFAGDGAAMQDLGVLTRVAHAVLADDGRIVVVVRSRGIGPSNFGLIRFNADGSPDTAFGKDGFATAAGSRVTEVAMDPAGRLIAAGGRTVARFGVDGALDTSFAGDGAFTFSRAKGFSASGLAVTPNGSLVLSGTGGRRGTHFAVAQLRKSGQLDRGFAGDGFAIVKLGGKDAALGVTVQDDGKIVAAGRARGRNLFIGGIGGRETKVAVARFDGG